MENLTQLSEAEYQFQFFYRYKEFSQNSILGRVIVLYNDIDSRKATSIPKLAGNLWVFPIQ